MTTIPEPPASPLSREMAEAAMREAVLNLTDDLAMRDLFLQPIFEHHVL